MVIGRTVIVNAGCDRLMDALRQWGYEPMSLELDEFIKSGGSAKCLTLHSTAKTPRSGRKNLTTKNTKKDKNKNKDNQSLYTSTRPLAW